MSSAASQASMIPTPRTPAERLELARDLFRRFHAQCFSHSPRDLEITEDLIPFVAKGPRDNGGHLGFMLAAKIQPNTYERANLRGLWRNLG